MNVARDLKGKGGLTTAVRRRGREEQPSPTSPSPELSEAGPGYLLEYPPIKNWFRPNLHDTQMQVGMKPFYKGISTRKDIADAGCDAWVGGDASIMAKMAIPAVRHLLASVEEFGQLVTGLAGRKQTKKVVFGAL